MPTRPGSFLTVNESCSTPSKFGYETFEKKLWIWLLRSFCYARLKAVTYSWSAKVIFYSSLLLSSLQSSPRRTFLLFKNKSRALETQYLLTFVAWILKHLGPIRFLWNNHTVAYFRSAYRPVATNESTFTVNNYTVMN